MAKLHLYRTYNFVDKDPVIDKVRTILQDENLYTKPGIVHELSGVSTTTLDNWFKGDTKRPQHATVGAIITSLGYEERFVKTQKLDIEKERAVAADWMLKQEKKEAKKKKTNGHARGKSK